MLSKLKISGPSSGPSSGSAGDASTASGPSGSVDTDDINEITHEGQSILMNIISQLRPGMDLTKITLPTFILEKKSMLERITNFFQIPQLLVVANREEDELKRFVGVVKWYLASWHIAPKAVKKPLNPVLGETYSCYWILDTTASTATAEGSGSREKGAGTTGTAFGSSSKGHSSSSREKGGGKEQGGSREKGGSKGHSSASRAEDSVGPGIASTASASRAEDSAGSGTACGTARASNATAYYVSEQCSHHPPKSSYFYIYPSEKIRVDGVVIPKSRFLGNSSAAIMEGLGKVTFHNWNETFTMNQPNVYCRGILFGKMRLELGDKVEVRSRKYCAEIEFKTKGFISGGYDEIRGTIKSSSGEELMVISGKWNEKISFKGVEELDVREIKTFPPVSIDGGALSSHRLWGPTIAALAARDHKTATAEKMKVEEEQRVLAKKRIEDGVEFMPRYFQRGKDLEYEFKWGIDMERGEEEIGREVEEVLRGGRYEIPEYRHTRTSEHTSTK
ncbi:OSH6 [Candida oxycetoniae]|uniref:OSH6 n=1 Tax=Candida oxycetoniae TaxID=497107 RepID=A0AAI9SYE5_9ASCO|nr:OSH6 [Candida oxycetoniae]KAI3405261.2 OSH6 [Candida oxycetoniae]